MVPSTDTSTRHVTDRKGITGMHAGKKGIFMQTDSATFQQMHTVRGGDMCGLIVDPGASAGIMGTETMREFVQKHLEATGLDYTLEPSTATFTGIDGKTDPGLGVANMPIGIPGCANVTFKADLIGDHGSKCPGLLPLESLPKCSAALFCDILEHRDGVLVLRIYYPDGKCKAHFVRM